MWLGGGLLWFFGVGFTGTVGYVFVLGEGGWYLRGRYSSYYCLFVGIFRVSLRSVSGFGSKCYTV